MDPLDLLRTVKTIEIKTRGLTDRLFSGEYHSAFKGRGMTFSEVREYQPGDEIRTIDWNVTARLNHPYVKVFEEERELTVMLAVDLSSSMGVGSRKQIKRHLLAELAAVLAFSATKNNDKVGAMLFTDTVELYIPPRKGRSHVLRIIREILEYTPGQTGTNLNEALRSLRNAVKRKCIAFVMSDFLDEQDYSRSLSIASRHHDIVALRLIDPLDKDLPKAGLIRLHNTESGLETVIDASAASVRAHWSRRWTTYSNNFYAAMKKSNVDFVDIATNQKWITPLMTFFRQREMRTSR